MNWAEVRRWQDMKAPGTMNEDPLTGANKGDTNTDVGYPKGLFDPMGYAKDPKKAEELKRKEIAALRAKMEKCEQEEAEMRCKLLREADPNHDVYVGPVGMWMPWEPEAYKTGRVEYLEEELNQLMNEKNKNEADAKQQFEKRVLEAKRNAIEENKKLAKETGNKLTQNVDKNGNLVGVNNTIENVFDNKEEVSSADIRKELFEGGNVERGGAVRDAIERGLLNENASETSLNNVNISISEKNDDDENTEN